MTLGEFRKATEHLPDDCELKTTSSDCNVSYPYDVDSINIKVEGVSEETPEPKTTIIIV